MRFQLFLLALLATPIALQAQETAPAQPPAQVIVPTPPAPAPVPPAETPLPATPAPAVTLPPGVDPRAFLAPGPNDPTDVQEVEIAAKPAAIFSGTATWDEGFSTIKSAFQTVTTELGKAGIAVAGRPLTVFVHTDDTGFRFEAMVPVAQVPEGKTELTPEVKIGKTPEGKSFRFVHKEAYDEIDGTYETITAYLDAKDIVAKDAFIEEYVNDLTDASDTNLEVNIYVQPKE
jgi:effector-binding domain-containing protein